MVETVAEGAAESGAALGGGQVHVHEAQIRFADLDPLNHVNNVRMLTYLEDARVGFLKWASDEEGGPLFGSLVVARHEVDYVRPLLLRRAPVTVRMDVAEVRTASFRLRYVLADEEHVYLRGTSVMVGFDLERQGVRRLDGGERSHLYRYLPVGAGVDGEIAGS